MSDAGNGTNGGLVMVYETREEKEIERQRKQITTLRQQVAELEAAEKRYFDVFRRISEAHGISSPLVLIGKAINDDENYAEILARIVEEKQSKVLAGDTKKDTSA